MLCGVAPKIKQTTQHDFINNLGHRKEIRNGEKRKCKWTLIYRRSFLRIMATHAEERKDRGPVTI